MNINSERSVRDLVIEMPEAMRIFEQTGIDYCCGGQRTLQESCRIAGKDVSEIITLLTSINSAAIKTDVPDWPSRSLTDLIEHIVDQHHSFTRHELERLEPLLNKVQQVHGRNHPELTQIQEAFNHLKEDLTTHLLKEEQVLFPYITRMETALKAKAPVPPAFFKTVRNPVRMMMSEHETAGDLLQQLRQMTSHYRVPADGCFSYQSLYRGLEGLEADLHQHIHLENNLLFPRAAEMEAQAVPEIQAGSEQEGAHSCFH
jgi:regulator of cell morphogenesis and NO signaling